MDPDGDRSGGFQLLVASIQATVRGDRLVDQSRRLIARSRETASRSAELLEQLRARVRSG